MQAIILAAGLGKRLGELTHDNTKCMIKVNGVSLISRMLIQLGKHSLSRVIIVVGYKAEILIEFIKEIEVSYPIIFVENPVFDQTNNIYSLYLARNFLEEEDTLLLESDLIFEDSVLDKIVKHRNPNLALVAKYESWMDGTVVTIDDDANITRFISTSKFKFEEIPDYYKTVNIYKFGREFSRTHYVPFLEAYVKALGTNEYYEQVLKVITLLDKPGIKALILDGPAWYEIDDIQDLDIAESIFAEDSIKLRKIEQRYGGYWRYPSITDFCYLVNPYFPNSKLIAEMKANFERLVCSYPSGMNINCLLAAKYFCIEQYFVVVGNGATELIKSVLSALGGKVGIVLPTFEEYPNRLKIEDIVSYIPENADFSYTAEDVQKYFSKLDISSLLIINPDNPSGNYIPQQEIIALCKWAKARNITMIVDESFVDFSSGFRENSLISDHILRSNENLIVIKSISKSYGVAGLRLGILVSAKQSLIARIRQDVSIWNINSLAEFYLQIFGKYDCAYMDACNSLAEERDRFFNKLSCIKYLRPIRSEANFILCEVLKPHTSRKLTILLLSKFNLLVKDCSQKMGFDGKNYIRIAVRNSTDNDRLVDGISNLLGEYNL